MEGDIYTQKMDPKECRSPFLDYIYFPPCSPSMKADMDGSHLTKVGHSASHLAWAPAVPGWEWGLPDQLCHHQASVDHLPLGFVVQRSGLVLWALLAA